jgi:acetyl-CoA C-acetyltransferase
MVSQACATSVAALHAAAGSVSAGGGTHLVVTTDRVSNGPLVSWPAPSAQAGAPVTSHWVLDSFAKDPWAQAGMLDAAEAVAGEIGATREELDDLTALRWEQYAASGDFRAACQVPVEIPQRKGSLVVTADEGVRPRTREAIAALPPAGQGAVHTFASQTHPADGCAGAIVTTESRARELSPDGIVRVLATGFSRAAKSRMPRAPVPAALSALSDAGLTIGDVHAITTHNPFAVNDLYFARETGVKAEDMNVHGCSLIFGHPQGPTGLRSVTELIETLRQRGGGIGLFTGCAAGDTGAALVLEVADK